MRFLVWYVFMCAVYCVRRPDVDHYKALFVYSNEVVLRSM